MEFSGLLSFSRVGDESRGSGEAAALRTLAGTSRPAMVSRVAVIGERTKIATDPDKSLVAFHGRLDNVDELRRVLQCGDNRDAALVLRACRRWARDAPNHLRGAFAFVYWNEAADELSMVSDHLGLQSLYYSQCDGYIAFSTGLRPLLTLSDVPRSLNDAYLAGFLSDLVPDPSSTFYAAINRVPAACAVIMKGMAAAKVCRYWEPDWGHRVHLPRDQDYIEEARRLLDQAVRRQLPASGPIVCQLSGGLDSSAVAATAARLAAPKTVHALTLHPPDGVARFETPDRFCDEREHAAAVAARYPNMRWEAISSANPPADHDDPSRLFLAFGMPLRNIMNVGWFAPSFDRARALGAKVVLGAAFGNMTLSWHGLSGLVGMARRGEWLRLSREASALAQAQGVSVATVLRNRVLKPLLPPAWRAWLGALAGRPRLEAERFSAAHPDFLRATRRGAVGLDHLGDTEVMRRHWLIKVQTVPGVLSAMPDAFGVELRDPTADIDLLEFCFAIPDEQYLRDGVTRRLARGALADRLPPVVLNETRRGMQCPEFLHRMTSRRASIVEGVAALERSPLASRVLDLARMKRLAHDWPTDAATTPFEEYGAVLNRGLHVGQFLRWLEGANQ